MFNTIMEYVNKIVGTINDALYGYVLIILLIAAGLYFTFRTGFAQFRLFPHQIRAVTEKPSDKQNVSSFQALMVSTASRVGTGNIIGVSTAICLGGFGSVFWMWIIAIIGGASALIESTLSQIYKRKGADGWYGGPAYYIENIFKKGSGAGKFFGILFSILLIVTYAFGFNMLASYNLQSTFSGYEFYNAVTSPWIIGGIIALLVGYCLFGGGKRIVKVTSFLVPVMGAIYILVALVIVIMNVTSLPAIFSRIFTEAFDFQAIFGGFTGSCVMLGIKRGLYSNEAGVGSAPNASATADVAHPVKQGLVQVLSVFLDTLLVCSATAFMCMCSGIEPTAELSGAPFVQQAMSATLGQAGPIFITVAMILFAFTTLIGNLYYVDMSLFYIMGRKPGKGMLTAYYIIAALVIFIGAGLSADLLWGIADITMGAMAVMNIPAILILGRYAFRALKDYERKAKSGEAMSFKASDIGLSSNELDAWK